MFVENVRPELAASKVAAKERRELDTLGSLADWLCLGQVRIACGLHAQIEVFMHTLASQCPGQHDMSKN